MRTRVQIRGVDAAMRSFSEWPRLPEDRHAFPDNRQSRARGHGSAGALFQLAWSNGNVAGRAMRQGRDGAWSYLGGR